MNNKMINNYSNFKLQIPSGAHTCYFNASSMKAITQFEIDKNKDMYQIGRSAERPVDFIVMDTVPGAEYISDTFATRSTISRFSCRIVVDRNPPHSVCVFAAAFDSKNSITLGVSIVCLPFECYSTMNFKPLNTFGSNILIVFLGAEFRRGHWLSGLYSFSW